jgi:hypothetical protein
MSLKWLAPLRHGIPCALIGRPHERFSEFFIESLCAKTECL